jgi:hypothetical protein
MLDIGDKSVSRGDLGGVGAGGMSGTESAPCVHQNTKSPIAK